MSPLVELTCAAVQQALLAQGDPLSPHFPTNTSGHFLPGSCRSFPILDVLPLSTLPRFHTPWLQILHISKARLCHLCSAHGSCSPLRFSRAGSMTNLYQFTQDSTGFKKFPHLRNSLRAEQTQPGDHCKRGVWQALKGQGVNILGSGGHTVTVANYSVLLLQHESSHKQCVPNGCGCVPIKLYLQKRAAGHLVQML